MMLKYSIKENNKLQQETHPPHLQKYHNQSNKDHQHLKQYQKLMILLKKWKLQQKNNKLLGNKNKFTLNLPQCWKI